MRRLGRSTSNRWHELCDIQALLEGTIAMAHPPADPAAESVLDADIEVLCLSLRTTNVLRLNQLHTVRDVVHQPPRKLYALSRLGRNSLREIVESVRQRGLQLAD
jgi:DNA-directed RNA polymerase alpha subunit